MAELFDSAFLKKLELLELVFRRAQAGRRDGVQTGVQRGGRIEFADYRSYTPGDDVRHVDWNVYGRTGGLFVKQFSKDEGHAVHILLDSSASMSFSRPSKFDYARRLALALGYVALCGGHAVEISSFSDSAETTSAAVSGRDHFRRLMTFLEALAPSGGTAVHAALRRFPERSPQRCLIILISDLLDESDPKRDVALLASRGYETCVFHLLSPDEREPALAGSLSLRDSETRAREHLRVDNASARSYLRELTAFREEWLRFCEAHQTRFFSLETDEPFEEAVIGYLRKGGLVR